MNITYLVALIIGGTLLVISAFLLLKRYYIKKTTEHIVSGDRPNIKFALDLNVIFFFVFLAFVISMIGAFMYQSNVLETDGEKEKIIQSNNKKIDSLENELKKEEKEIRLKIYKEIINEEDN